MSQTSDHLAATETLCSVNAAYPAFTPPEQQELRSAVKPLVDALILDGFTVNPVISEATELNRAAIGTIILAPTLLPGRPMVLRREIEGWAMTGAVPGAGATSDTVLTLIAADHTVTVVYEPETRGIR